MINAILTSLEELITAEKRRSYDTERYFNSAHEAFGVLCEEVEEMAEESASASAQLGVIWHRIRNDERIGTMVVNRLREYATKTAAEAVQVAAMCDKLMESEPVWRCEK